MKLYDSGDTSLEFLSGQLARFVNDWYYKNSSEIVSQAWDQLLEKMTGKMSHLRYGVSKIRQLKQGLDS